MPTIRMNGRTAQIKNAKGEPFVINFVHPESACKGRPCTFHNPTEHPMSSWDFVWRTSRGYLERICPQHKVGHPDPDSMFYFFEMGRRDALIHGCCGCCEGSYDDLLEKFPS